MAADSAFLRDVTAGAPVPSPELVARLDMERRKFNASAPHLRGRIVRDLRELVEQGRAAGIDVSWCRDA